MVMTNLSVKYNDISMEAPAHIMPRINQGMLPPYSSGAGHEPPAICGINPRRRQRPHIHHLSSEISCATAKSAKPYPMAQPVRPSGYSRHISQSRIFASPLWKRCTQPPCCFFPRKSWMQRAVPQNRQDIISAHSSESGIAHKIIYAPDGTAALHCAGQVIPGIKANAEHNADYRYDSARVQCPFPFVYEYPAHEISSPVTALNRIVYPLSSIDAPSISKSTHHTGIRSISVKEPPSEAENTPSRYSLPETRLIRLRRRIFQYCFFDAIFPYNSRFFLVSVIRLEHSHHGYHFDSVV